MAKSLSSTDITSAIDTLREAGVVPAVAGRLEEAAGRINAALKDSVVAEVPAYTQSGNPDVLPELEQHLAAHTSQVSRLLAGRTSGDLGFVCEHARRRAEQKFPLESLLAAYRSVHKVLSVRIRDAALETADETAHVRRVVSAVTDLMIEYTGAISTLITAEYVTQTRLLAEAEGDRRTELLNVLLGGFDEADGRVARLLRQGGYLRQRQSYCVVAAQPVIASEMQNPARAQRLADALKASIRQDNVRCIVGVRDNSVVGIFSSTRRQSGWTAPQSLLAGRLQPQLLQVGVSVLIGVSSDAPSTAHIPRALDEATLALEFASVDNRVVQYTDIPIRRMMLRLAREKLHDALPAWADALQTADGKMRGALNATLHAYADADMNVLKAAEQLGVHPNTIYSRFNKVQDVTGKSALAYHQLTELLLAVDCRSD